ncbi:hypothetical protein [Vibrio splendidus]|uniref:hypothetical protein n=1 Tax=Vibrio splendidus TaxID=29497 RepID=UPI0002EF896D|nr:hypothetical protein [Vibrio splendidus]
MSTVKIQRAFCVELDEYISIDTARREYFSLPEKRRRRLNFLCSDEFCRYHNETGVRVTGVNYDKLCKERSDGKPVIKAAHYRENDKHHPNCEWSLASSNEEHLKQRSNESSEDYSQRKIRHKLEHFIDEFSPELDDESTSNKNGESELKSKQLEREPKKNNGSSSHRKNSPSKTVTSVLSRLVETWLEAKEVLSDDEFKKVLLNVKGVGRVLLYRYFKPVKYYNYDKHIGVAYGGATLVKRYGKGFKFKFYDKIKDKQAYLYCDKKLMESYRYRNYIESILTLDCHYFNVYILAPKVNEKEEYVTYEINSLKNIHIIARHVGDKSN